MELSPSTALLGLVLVFTSIFLHGCGGIIAEVEEDLERKPVPEKCESIKFGVPGHEAGVVSEAFEGEEPRIICPKDHYYFGYDIMCARSRKVCIAKTPQDIQMPLCTYIYGFVVTNTNISDWPAKTLPDILDPALIAPELRKKYETDNTDANVHAAVISVVPHARRLYAGPRPILRSDLKCYKLPKRPGLLQKDALFEIPDMAGEEEGTFSTGFFVGACVMVAGVVFFTFFMIGCRVKVRTASVASDDDDNEDGDDA